MPFQSEAQRKFLWMRHPEIAKRWAEEYPGQGPKTLPQHVTATATRRTAVLSAMRKMAKE